MQSIRFNVGTVKVLAYAYPVNKILNDMLDELGTLGDEPLPLIYAHYFNARTWPDEEGLAPMNGNGSIANVVGNANVLHTIQTIGAES